MTRNWSALVVVAVLWPSVCCQHKYSPMPSPYLSERTNREKAYPVLPDELLFGSSAAMEEVRRKAEKVCRTNLPILLYGEGGTGKEVLARWIHQNSEYGDGEFVKINCAAISEPLLESELFGYEKGTFHGADEAKPGRLEAAQRGTLFLDEVAELSLNAQSKLLQLLQDGTYTRNGDHAEHRVDTRVLCATNKDLAQEISAGRFREDLFDRIGGFQLRMPRLSQRREDIPFLAEFFRKQHEAEFGITTQPFVPEMLEYLQNLDWKGNVRELSNGVARYLLIGPEAVVEHEELHKRTAKTKSNSAEAGVVPLKRVAKDAIKEMERSVILEALRTNRWNRRKTAMVLKISYRSLIYKIRDAGLVSSRTSKVPGARHQGGHLLDSMEKK